MVPSEQQERDMDSGILELSLEDLTAVSGGMRNLANDPGFHLNIGPRNGSPLYGNGSFHDTIDHVDGLP
jgi:hypothetical protein